MEEYLKEHRKHNEGNLYKSQDYFDKQLSFISAGVLMLQFIVAPLRPLKQ